MLVRWLGLVCIQLLEIFAYTVGMIEVVATTVRTDKVLGWREIEEIKNNYKKNKRRTGFSHESNK